MVAFSTLAFAPISEGLRNTKRIGTASEAAVVLRFAKLGYRISIPFGEATPYDLIVESPAARLFRIQVKTGRIRRGVIVFSSVSSHHHRGRPATRYHGKIEAFAVYCPANDRCYLIALDEPCLRAEHPSLRIEPARNNMQRGVHWAERFVFNGDEEPMALRKAVAEAPDGD